MSKESLENLILLLACILYLPFRGFAYKKTNTPQRVVIVQMAHLGDMVCTTPMFRAVKEKYPESKLFVVGNAINKEVLKGNPDVDDYLVWSGKPLGMILALRTLKPDFGLVTGPNFSGLAALFLAGVGTISAPYVVSKERIPLETKPFKVLRRWVHLESHVLGSYAPQEYLKLLAPIGISVTETKKYVFSSEGALESVLEKLRNSAIGTRKFAIIAPGAGHPAKRWPGERFAQVAEHIASRYMPVVVIGGGKDAPDVEVMMNATDNKDVVDFSANPSIDELKALVSRASLFVSVDTGPLYIAEAYGVPTIDIVGPASETVQPPIGPKNLVLVPERESPTMTMFHTRVIDPVETKRQAEATSIEEVIAAVDTLMSRV